MSQRWKIGDVVCLNSGGPVMTVNELGDLDSEREHHVSCVWIENGRLCEADLIHQDTLSIAAEEAFVGEYFLSLKDGVVEWQGQVLNAVPDRESYQVEIFSWITGDPVERRIVSIDQMEQWRFYENIDQLSEAYSALKRVTQ